MAKLGVLRRELVVGGGHVDHHGAFPAHFDIPEGVGQGCDRTADPSCYGPYGLPKLVALIGRLEHEPQDGEHPGGDGGGRVLPPLLVIGRAHPARAARATSLPSIKVAASAAQLPAALDGDEDRPARLGKDASDRSVVGVVGVDIARVIQKCGAAFGKIGCHLGLGNGLRSRERADRMGKDSRMLDTYHSVD